ncbi:MAG TPA: DUF1015 family protein [Clostridia bacterium]|nr:DUF1015 family protein [Clostridia bacterium]
MATVKAFKAIRPTPELADKVAALPYDVMDSDEAREMVKGNPYSFLHVDKAEIDLDPSIDHYDKKVYEKARDNMLDMIKAGTLKQDGKSCLYIYKQVMNGRAQIGLVGCTSIDEYINNIIKKHEFTRADKEQDRINHVDYCNANTGPIFLTYRAKKAINDIVEGWMKAHKAVYDFVSEDGIGHTVWVIDDETVIKKLEAEFEGIDFLYIADGHHRSASAVKVGLKRREQFPNYKGDEEFNFFLSVLFPDEQLYIMDYNRVVKDLNGNSTEGFISKVEAKFSVEPYNEGKPFKPTERHTFGMYLEGKWYKLTAKAGTYNEADPVDRLDVSIMQNNLLNPVLGIQDPRTDKRIDFVGGIRGLKELEKRVDAGMKVAFSMCPTTIDDLMSIADAGKVMPPKSTWFEPKLRSGLFIHEL